MKVLLIVKEFKVQRVDWICIQEMSITENYNDFLNRISYQQADLQIGEGYFNPDGRAYEKVNPDNTFKPFYGNTVVFDLDSSTKTRIYKIIEKLYKSVPECFCQRLDKSTLHMTLHDLSASDNLDSIMPEVFYNEIKLLQIIIDYPQNPQTIRMKTNFVINMVSTSLVLALVPADEAEWDKLQTLYDLINEVKICPYPYLTPHITLAYFNYNGFDAGSVQKLKEVVNELNKESFEITLNSKKLVYQKFTSMNDYISIFNLV
ncbi:MAG: hypothetical protein SOT80_09640 [Candidatus Pseudoruminococcus sp.]|nr:hypothetical protein [Ruminococcus bromii]MDY2783638.1 hypothetical protein [Candidatus Pseudoruminococcus sp.]